MKTDRFLAMALCGAVMLVGLAAPVPASAMPALPDVSPAAPLLDTVRTPDTRAYKRCRRKYRYMRHKGRNRSGIYYWQAVDSCVRGA